MPRKKRTLFVPKKKNEVKAGMVRRKRKPVQYKKPVPSVVSLEDKSSAESLLEFLAQINSASCSAGSITPVSLGVISEEGLALREVDKAKMALWTGNRKPQELPSPDDSLMSLAEFVIAMLSYEPTRVQLSQASGKNRRRISTVLSILKGLNLAEDQVEKEKQLKLNEEQLLVLSDVKKFSQIYTSLRNHKKMLVEVYHSLLQTIRVSHAPPNPMDDILVPDFTNLAYLDGGLSSCFLKQPREWDCEE